MMRLQSTCRWLCGAALLTVLGGGCRRTAEDAAPRPESAASAQSTGTAQSASTAEEPAAPARLAGWPSVFGPRDDSSSGEAIDLSLIAINGPAEKWRRAIGVGYSSPVTADGKVIVQQRVGDEEVIACYELESGLPLWEHRYATDYECAYEYTNGPYGTPRIHEGKVYSFGAQWQARCLDLASGDVVWRRELRDDYEVEEGLFGFGPGILIDEGRVIFNLGAADAGVIALDAATGQTLWTSGRDRAGYAMPRAATVHGRRHAFVLTFEGLQALDPATGEQRFFVPFTNKVPLSVAATSPVVWDDKVLLVTGPGPGALCVRVTPEGGYEQVWKNRRAIDSQWNTLMRVGGVLYGFTSKRVSTSFRAVNLDDGTVRWQWASDLQRGTALRTADAFVLWGEHGHLAFMPIDKNRERPAWFSEAPLLDSPTYASPALDRGLLLLRNEGTLLCLSLRPEDLAQE